jgi:FHS family L-fucose permease-like MFS transporter
VLSGALILSGTVLSGAELDALSAPARAAYRAQEAAAVQGPYLVLAGSLLSLALLFGLATLPRIAAPEEGRVRLALRRHPRLLLGTLAIFLYVGAEVSIGSFLINFLGSDHIAAKSPAAGAAYVGDYWGGAMVGRFVGAAVMRRVRPGIVLALNAGCSVGLILLAVCASGPLAMWPLLAVGLCNSIMFPTIFSMALHKLGAATG